MNPITNLAPLLDDVVEFIRQYVVVPDDVLHALALWVFHTHAIEASNFTPYLYITGPDSVVGKTRLIEVLQVLVKNEWYTTGVTASSLARYIDTHHPTLLLDEVDKLFKGSEDRVEGVTTILNDGFRRSGQTTINVTGPGGWHPDLFQVFCAKALAGIDRPDSSFPDTMHSRSIRIDMRRKKKSEPVDKFRRNRVERLVAPLRSELSTAAEMVVNDLAGMENEGPDGLEDRAADVWEPLLVIAEYAGGPWPDRARQAALALSTGSVTRISDGIKLLDNVATLFLEGRADRLASEWLVGALNSNPDWGWGDYKGRGLTKTWLAKLLGPYGIKSANVRAEGSVVKGYKREDLWESWERYTPDHDLLFPAKPATAATDATPADNDGQAVTVSTPAAPTTEDVSAQGRTKEGSLATPGTNGAHSPQDADLVAALT